MAPFCGLLIILSLALLETKGNPGGLAVNQSPGEVIVNQFGAPDFSLASLNNGPTLSKSSLSGSFVLIDFWSSWCPPCRAEADVLVDVYGEFENQGIEFIGIAVWDSPSQVLRHMEKHDIHYPNALDLKGEIAINFGIKGIPEKYLLNPNGDIIGKFTGPTTRTELIEFIQSKTQIAPNG